MTLGTPIGTATCKGSYMLGTACGSCSRCLEESGPYIAKLKGVLWMMQDAAVYQAGARANETIAPMADDKLTAALKAASPHLPSRHEGPSG